MIRNVRCEYAVNPLGIEVTHPRLSWEMLCERRGARQSAYQVLVATSEAQLRAGVGDLWDSGKVASNQSMHIDYAGTPLPSRCRCYWTVRVWDECGELHEPSEVACWEMGLLESHDWQASWIGIPPMPGADTPMSPCPHVRKDFTLTQPVVRARAYVSALGVYELYLNGQRVGDDIFAPGWTDYNVRVQYQTYDVTALLTEGRNTAGMLLGDGWYAGYLSFQHMRNLYGASPLALCQLEVEYADGSSKIITSDAAWQGAFGPILYSDFQLGEYYDARKELPGWNRPDYRDDDWQHVTVHDIAVQRDAERGPAVRKVMELPVTAVTAPTPGSYIFDLGQNMVGWTRLRVSGHAGDTITLRHGEMLNPDGTLYTENLRDARCADTYILKGDGQEVFEPHFTFRGFRYVEMTGYAGPVSPEMVTGVVVSSATPSTGAFACSTPMINRLQSNIVWGQRGNFLSIPTDCPQRNERLGWTGDAQIFIRTAAFNADVAGFFTKWLIDVDDAQTPDGAYTDVAPRIGCGEGVAGWADAGVICPWTIYLCYGDTRIIDEHYPGMQRFIAYCREQSIGLIRPAEGYGDWLSINADTPKDLLSTAYFAYSTRLLARMARIIGKDRDAALYEDLFQQIKWAFNKAFVDGDGRIMGDTQTAYVMALYFDLLPQEKREAAACFLVEDIERKGWHLSTGFLGVGYLLPTLTQIGRLDVAYRLLNNETFPSWGYSIKHGATTIWERWNGWTAEQGFFDPEMNSFNHYSLGSVGQWMYDTVAGIAPDAEHPAYKHVIIRPQPGGGITCASGQLDSMYGRIASAWRCDTGAFSLNVTIPANTTATVYLPGKDPTRMAEGGLPVADAEGVTFLRFENGCAVFSVASGSYAFTAPASSPSILTGNPK